MTAITFAYLPEGSSDAGLLPHLRVLCVRAGASEAIGTAPDLARLPNPPGHSVEQEIRALIDLGANPDIFFIHRDANSRGPEVVRQEIRDAATAVDPNLVTVPVVPAPEMEAWLLHERAIREVVGRPNGRQALKLPRAARIEELPRAKELLSAALLIASEARGRRRERVSRQFGLHRSILLERLDPDGPVTRLATWQTLAADTEVAVQAVFDDRAQY